LVRGKKLSGRGVIMIKWVLIMVLVLPASVIASENCVEQYKGICRDACSPDEIAAEGAFIDCGEKQDCCVPKPPQKEQTRDTESKEQWKKQKK
jgi:hypothetical protein